MKKIFSILSLFPILVFSQTEEQNYVKTSLYKAPTSVSDLSKTQVNVTYYDGLGRPVQQVINKAAQSGNDIITIMTYDSYNRQTKEYLPYASADSSTDFDESGLQNTIGFYNDPQFENTENPYSEKFYESSPLNRVVEQGAPGSAWKIDRSLLNFSQTLTASQIFDCQGPNPAFMGTIGIEDNVFIVRLKTDVPEGTLLLGCTLSSNPVGINTILQLPDMELGPINNSNGEPTGYKAIVKNNMLRIFPVVENVYPTLSSLDTSFAIDLTYKFGSGHTIKYDYQTNTTEEVIHFRVNFPGTTEKPELQCIGYYGANQLYKGIIRDENWIPSNKNNKTVHEFKDKEGNLILKRTFDDDVPHDTYYVYDDYSNLTYVIPPLAAEQVADIEVDIETAGRYYMWTDLAVVDQALADLYEKDLMDYENHEILNVDLLDKYGGQGGFLLNVDEEGNPSVTINVTTAQAMPYRVGAICDMRDLGVFPDKELGRVVGPGYDYYFVIKDNMLEVSGQGNVPSLNTALTGSSRLEYSKNYPWTYLCVADPNIANDYEDDIEILDNSQILNTYTPNTYGASGGVAISLDENNLLTFSLNITSSTLLALKSGAAFPLDIQRRIPDMVLGTVEGDGYRYDLRIINNYLTMNGSGLFTHITFNATPMSVASFDIVQEAVEGLCYIYHYDYRNRMIEKHIPGKGWDHIVYDKLDRPILVQDENLRLNDQWLFTKHDAFGRVVYTGLYTDPEHRDRHELQADLNLISNPVLYESRTTASFINSGMSVQYTSDAFPDQADTELYTVDYYDDYNFALSGIVVPATAAIDLPGTTYDFSGTIISNPKGLPSVNKVRVLGTSQWTTSVLGYNDKEQVIYSQSRNEYLATHDILITYPDFRGKTIASKVIHYKNTQPGTGQPDVTIANMYDYDSMDRLLSQRQMVNNNPVELISFNEYDDVSRLISKKVGGQTVASQIGYTDVNGLQLIDYTYNIRGWLKMINDTEQPLINDLFAFKINYNTTDEVYSEKLYNGNISETYWKSKTDNKVRGYSYTYDALNRLTNAGYVGEYILEDNPAYIENYSEGNITYDKNGNIMHLDRWGLEGTDAINKIDQLAYIYEPFSNRLKLVNDDAGADGFNNGSTGTGQDFTYDAVGNMVTDANKGITAVTYNHLNLPKEVFFGPDSYIAYTYDAMGTKLQKKVVENTVITGTTHYAGGYFYKDGVLQFFSHPEGYVKNENGNFSYIYQYKDHLGNVRLSYSDDNNSGSITQNEVIEEDNYYAFGLKHKGYNKEVQTTGNAVAQNFKYNGKELSSELGLEFYDFGARNYDPAIGRWMNIDPLAEKMRRHSPYNYAFNNPVYYIDPDGMEATAASGGETLTEDDFDVKVDVGYGRMQKVKNISTAMNYSADIKLSKSGEAKFERAAAKDILSQLNKNNYQDEKGKKPAKTTSRLIHKDDYSNQIETTFTHADFIEYYRKETKQLENIIEKLTLVATAAGSKGLVEYAKDIFKGDFKMPSWSTLAATHLGLTADDLSNQLEMLRDIKYNYDRMHKLDPSSNYGVIMIHTRAHIPVHGGSGINIYSFKDIYSGKDLGTVQ